MSLAIVLSRMKMLLVGTLVAVTAILVTATFAEYAGSTVTLAVFHACYITLLVLAIPRPRFYFYTFFAIFLFLGFWPKVVIQTIWAVGFIEPVGNFSGSPAEWDAALQAATSGALGVILVRVAQLILGRNRAMISPERPQTSPEWYPRHRVWIWPATLILMVLLNVLNLHYAFFQIGVNPKLILPLKLNVLVGWLLNVGFAFWIAALVHWEQLSGKPALGMALLAPIAEAFVSSVCTLSRLTYLLHTAPYWVALCEKWKSLRTQLSGHKAGMLIAAFLLAFVVSVYSVFWLRVNVYYYSEPAGTTTKEVHRTIALQLPHLFVQRWTGLEGTLVVSSAPDRGLRRLVEVVTTDPALGTKSLYQQLAKVHYHSEDPDKFTFLANAGIVAILLFSGSLTVVMLGMALITALLILTEAFVTRLLQNDFFRAMAGASLANLLAQTTFPYLSMIFFLQLCVAVIFLTMLQRMRIPVPATALPRSSK
jgi:hypothetical protein